MACRQKRHPSDVTSSTKGGAERRNLRRPAQQLLPDDGMGLVINIKPALPSPEPFT
jgi:hypothetical protein